jgi:alginate O-acetyltransferase complex protein AlgI
MLFNSLAFVFFFLVVFLLSWFVFKRDLKQQNLLLLIASLFFYSCWDWRFLVLLLFSISLDFFTGYKIYINSKKKLVKKFWLSILLNLGLLGFFKYFNS